MPVLIRASKQCWISWLIIMCWGIPSYADQYPIDIKYGNGQSKTFMDAMYASGPDITEAELQAIQQSVPPRISNRFFIRIGANWGKSTLGRVNNYSVAVATKDAQLATNNYTSPAKIGAELACGYRWDRFSIELEAIAIRNFKFNLNPLFNNQPGQLESTIKSQGGFLNFYYDIVEFMPVRAFVGAGIGVGINSTDANFSNAAPVSTGSAVASRNIAGAYNLLAGIKLNIASRLFICGTVRYTNIAAFGSKMGKSQTTTPVGKIVWQDKAQNLFLKGQHSLFGFSFSIIHVCL